MPQTALSVFREIYDQIFNHYDPEESRAITFWIMEEKLNISKEDVLAQKSFSPDQKQRFMISKVIERLKANEPIQHILGYAWFYGRKFRVNHHVLIPRQETEELVHWILSVIEKKVGVKVLDIGTGSGIIPITLKLENQAVKSEGWDISTQAINVARQNADLLSADIKLGKVDILHTKKISANYDIIVSNPPYIMRSEMKIMDKIVTDHDPEIALLVEDSDPLIFYQKIMGLAHYSLNKGGSLFFEINERFGQQICDLLTNKGYKKVELRKDLNGKERMIRAQL